MAFSLMFEMMNSHITPRDMAMFKRSVTFLWLVRLFPCPLNSQNTLQGFASVIYLSFCYRMHDIFDAKEVSDSFLMYSDNFFGTLHSLCSLYSMMDVK